MITLTARIKSFSVMFLCTTAVVGHAYALSPKPTYPEYALYFSPDGLPLDHASVIPAQCIDPDKPSVVGWRVLTETCFNSYVSRIIDGIKASKKTKVLVFIHGGLNGLSTARARVVRLIDAGDGPGTLRHDYYPIFINWQASFFSSYLDHLIRVRQGLKRPGIARSTALPVLIEDTVVGAVRIIPDSAELSFNRPDQHASLLGPNIRHGCDLRSPSEKVWETVSGVPLIPIKPLSTGLVLDAFGSQAWDMMVRRTELMFHREASRVDQTVEHNATLAAAVQEPLSVAAFLRSLTDALRENGISADLVAHSAGAIIANRALREIPDIPIRNIVYMAAASSLEDYETTVIGDGDKTGFLALHPGAQVYHLVLHPQAELHEFNWAYGAGLLIPRGSLLDWLDDFLTNPTALRQRMAGKISNLAQRLQAVPPNLQDRVHVKVFDFGVALRNPPSSGAPTELIGWYEWCDQHQNLCQPQKHGDFSEMPFWAPWLIEPKSLAEVSKPGCTD